MIEIVHRYQPGKESEIELPEDGDAAVERLVEGNRASVAFWSLVKTPHDDLQDVIPFDPSGWGVMGDEDSAPAHEPFAAVLSCSDARVPAELVFRQTLNDLFVVRLAGNVVTAEGVGSLAYAVRHLAGSLRLLVVLGHSGCGAVTAAADAYLDPAKYPNIVPDIGLRTIVDRILPAVRLAATALDKVAPEGGAEEYRNRLIQLSVVLNAAMGAMTMAQLTREVIGVNCKVVFGTYDIASKTTWAPELDRMSEVSIEPHLASPPDDQEELQDLANALARWTEL